MIYEFGLLEVGTRLSTDRSTRKALGYSSAVEGKGAEKRVLSAARRAAIAKAARQEMGEGQKRSEEYDENW
jgi:hypothetical protein